MECKRLLAGAGNSDLPTGFDEQNRMRAVPEWLLTAADPSITLVQIANIAGASAKKPLSRGC